MILLSKKPDWLIEMEKRGEGLRASRLLSQKKRLKEKTMKLKMSETVKGASDPSGSQVKEYQEGETYEVHESLARVFLKENWAEEVKAKKAAPENKAKGKAPENKAKK